MQLFLTDKGCSNEWLIVLPFRGPRQARPQGDNVTPQDVSTTTYSRLLILAPRHPGLISQVAAPPANLDGCNICTLQQVAALGP